MGKLSLKSGLLLLFIVFSVPASLVEYVYLLKKKSRSIVIYSLVSFFIQFVLVVVPVLLGKGIIMSLKGLVLSAILRYVWFWILLITFSEIKVSWKFIVEHIKLGSPLIVATLLSGSAQFVDGFIVTSKFDEATFAVFRYGARELPLAMLLANALSNAMLPEFSVREKMKENLVKLKTNITQLMHFLFPLTAVLLVFSHPVFPILFNPKFEESATIFNIYLLLIISRLLLPQTILNGLKLSREIMLASLLELILNVSLSLFLVQFYGIAGIAFATFVAYLFEKIFLVIVVQQKLNIQLKEYLPVKFYMIYSAGVLIIFTFAEVIF
jgi:O-antigen/teichoic acid export membrane protein